MKIFWAIITVLSVFAGFDCSGGHNLHTADGWARAAKENETTGAYVLITNNTKKSDTLGSVTSEDAGTQLMETVMVDGVSQARPAASGIAVPAGKELQMKPTGTYIQLSNLKKPLIPGATIHLTLNFSEAGVITQSILIEPAKATKYED